MPSINYEEIQAQRITRPPAGSSICIKQEQIYAGDPICRRLAKPPGSKSWILPHRESINQGGPSLVWSPTKLAKGNPVSKPTPMPARVTNRLISHRITVVKWVERVKPSLIKTASAEYIFLAATVPVGREACVGSHTTTALK